MKQLFLILCSLFLMSSCGTQKPLTTTHTERIEERLKPIAIGADTIEITLSHTDNYRLTECTENTETTSLRLSDNGIINDFEQSEKSNFRELRGFRERNKNSVRVKSTRAINIQQTKTDTTSTLRITLRPDTVYLPYTHHIRSDTIIVQDKICKTKLQKTQTANVLLILILIAVIIFFIRRQKYRRT